MRVKDKMFLGQKHTKATKDKIKIVRKKQFPPMLGKTHTKITKLKISNKLKGRKLSKKTKLKMMGRVGWLKGKTMPSYIKNKLSIAMIKRINNNGGVSPANYSKRRYGRFYSKKNNKYIRYESGYELMACKSFEKDDSIKSYDRCKRVIKYYFNKYRHRYLPDYEITYNNGVKNIIEIKPNSQIKKEKNIAKFKFANSYCNKNGLKFKTLTEMSI
ncbi:MAG: TnsA endonuclease N-terminal domain-containing protein [Nanoarchaeota archaeon]|nr:TnsA endonuclease N-terminal domain-containing protein [Nanoarchaeota archaeon]